MTDEALNELLKMRDALPPPELPATFRQDVWRAIRGRTADRGNARGAWLVEFLQMCFHPAMAFSALALAAMIGISLGSTAIDSRAAQTRMALHLEVFGVSPPALPSTSLLHAK